MCKLLKELGLRIDPNKKDKAKWKSVSKDDLAYAKKEFGAKGAQLEDLTGKVHKLTGAQGKLLDQALEDNLKRRNNKWLKDRSNYKPLAQKLVENILKPVKEDLDTKAKLVLADPVMTQVPKDANQTEITAAGIETARTAVKNALKDYDTRLEADITTAKNLLPKVAEAIDTAEKAAASRLVKKDLDTKAKLVLADPVMTQVPKDANQSEITAAGVATARTAVKNALKDYDTRLEADITTAKNLLPAVQSAIEKAEKAAVERMAKSDYEVAFELIKVNFLKADKIDDQTRPLKLAKMAVVDQNYVDAYNERSNATTASNWVAAKDSLPALNKASTELIKIGEPILKEKKSFDKEFGKVLNLETAKNIAKKPPLTLLKTEVKVFGEKYQVVNDGRTSGEFAAGKKGVPALMEAITKLIEANQKIEAQKLKFNEEKAKITDYETAQALALAKSPAVTDKIAAFNLADGNVLAQVKKEDWVEALKLIGALKTATEELLKARNQSNSTLTEEAKKKFAEKMKALESRTDVAKADGPTQHVNGLKAIVTGVVKKIASAVSAGDYASAEVLHTQLLPDLDKMEKAIEAYNEHFAKYDQAKKGPVKTSLAVPLAPQKLKTERTKALQATEDRIFHFAEKGSIQKANDLVTQWITEAKAWESAKAAYDNLNTGAEPNENALKTLQNLPGGGKVLDALMDGLPEGKPQKFLMEAIKIRYGITVKRFEAKVKDDKDLKAVGPNAPDLDLKKMYQLFGKVPLSNVKGKVTDLIQFDKDDSGASAGGSRISMYCGRANDPSGTKQMFGVEGEVLPAGEEVEEAFKPVDNKELPYFDFAALHEVGHCVDSAKKIMAEQAPGKIAGWQSHTRDAVAAIAAKHFDYDLQFVKDTLADPKSNPPTVLPNPKTGVLPAEWDKRREKVVNWCRSVREGASPWGNGSLSKFIAIDGRVYQEAYEGRPWVSYLYAARTKGITGYQFRSAAEWFAELYAAYFSKKLKDNHPYAAWLKPLKKIT